MSPPEGYKPPVAFSLLPLGGLYIDFCLWFVDCGNDCLQIKSFLCSHNTFFGLICAFFVGLTFYLQMKRTECNPCRYLNESIKSGKTSGQWLGFKLAEQNIEAAGTGLVAPYGMAHTTHLTTAAMSSGVMGILFSIFNMSAGQVIGAECGKASHAALVKAIVPLRLKLVSAWYCIGFGCELSALAMACCVLHPVLVLPWFLGNFIANVGARNFMYTVDGELQWKKNMDKFPQVLMFGRPPTSLMGISVSADFGIAGQRIFISCATACRIVAWFALMFLVDLPAGLFPFASLGRPMGYSVLRSGFLTPAEELVKSVLSCMDAAIHQQSMADITQCSLAEFDDFSTDTVIFRTVLMACVMLSTPIYLIGSLSIPAVSPSIRNDTVDADLKQRIDAIHADVNEWSERKKLQNEEYYQLPTQVG